MRIERQLQGTLNTIFTELIKERGLENRLSPYSARVADAITIQNAAGSNIFILLVKIPTTKTNKSVYSADTIITIMEKAQNLNIPYYGVCNCTHAIFCETQDIVANSKLATTDFLTLSDVLRLKTNFLISPQIEYKLRNIVGFYLDNMMRLLP